jgi:hypothetical protein
MKQAFDIPRLLFDIEHMDAVFRDVLGKIRKNFTAVDDPDVTCAQERLACSLIVALDNINQNIMVQYFHIHDQFDTWLHLMRQKTEKACMLLSLLLLYNKNEGQNVYQQKLLQINDVNVFSLILRMSTSSRIPALSPSSSKNENMGLFGSLYSLASGIMGMGDAKQKASVDEDDHFIRIRSAQQH